MPFKVAKTSETPENREPGTWKEIKLLDGEISATFTCPQCGAYGSLEDHEINMSGAVNPSVICPNECGFHDFIILEGWLGINGAHLTNLM